MVVQFLKELFNNTSTQMSSKEILHKIDSANIPAHIAIIMDGNGRWAKKRGLPRTAGHRAGVESLKAVVEACGSVGVKVLTVYAFSTENWKRPQEEVSVLMSLLSEYIDKELETLYNKGIKVNTIGDIENLPLAAQNSLEKAKKRTCNNHTLLLNLALNYGARAELVKAAKEIAKKVKDNQVEVENIDEALISTHLFTNNIVDPDLLIRPSGELRISNFLLWQLAYTEFWYTDILWPDFREEHLYKAIMDYQKRDRRFGGLKL
ncbi:MAG: isoprenyl transferase [Bacillota bacterium]|nr:isoprenyl transferase [Bacillota bacterium]